MLELLCERRRYLFAELHSCRTDRPTQNGSGFPASIPGPVQTGIRKWLSPDQPWPLPECRVNEWTLLVELLKARAATMPLGDAVPIGASFGMDTGTQWFHDVMNAGHHIAHVDTFAYARHAWASSTGGGFPALSDRKEYDRGEALAFEHLRTYYPRLLSTGTKTMSRHSVCFSMRVGAKAVRMLKPMRVGAKAVIGLQTMSALLPSATSVRATPDPSAL